MKRLLYSLVIYLLVSLSALAQNEGISFQGLARNAAGEVLVNQKISLRLSILLDSESGVVAYIETRQATTNPQGIFAVVLGDDNTLTKSTNFSTIKWTPAPKFIKVEMDPNAGTNFTTMGTSKLQAVPFAFYAYGVDAENVEGILPLGSGGTGVASIAELKKNLGVDQVDNTADANKPLSAASQAALSTKANTADVTTSLASKVDKVTGKELSTNDYTTAEKVKLAAISGTNTGDQDLSAFATRTQLETKVDKEIGKGLSSNDFTTAEKTKLAGITGNVAGPTGPIGPAGATGPAGAIGPQGPIGLTGPAGSQGIQGPTGATGAAGVDGKTVLNGTATPTNQGVDGDFYINTATNMLFGPKANGVWPTGVSLVGPQGAQGSTGAAGAQGIPGPTGAVGPAPSGTGIVTVSSGTLQTPGALTGDVTTSAAGLVTSIATGAVTSDKLLDGTIATADLANSAVTDEKIAGVAGSKVSGNITGNAANVTGTVAVGNGGTGATTLTANSVLVGNGTSAVQAVAPGTSGNVLTSNGTTWTSAAPSGGGVPYTGATGAVNLGAYNLTVNGVTVGKGFANIADNTAIGINALNAASSSGGGNSAFGYQALQANTTGGNSNSAFGYKALTANTSGSNNTAIGASSLLSNTAGYDNIGIGASSLVFNTEGDYNIGIGAGALQQNKLGNTNIAIGREAGFHLNSYNYSSGTGSGNIFIGYQSGISRNRGSNNTAIGQQSLFNYFDTNFYDYSNAVAIGIQSGFTNKTNNNTFLGSFADVDYTNNSAITNATAVGYQAKVVASNSIQLGNTSVTNVKTSGTLTAGTVTYPNTHGSANQVLSTTGSGTLAWTTPATGLPSSGNTAGDMLYWNGSAWVKVAAGTDGQTLTFIGGRPVWSGSLPANTVVNSTTGKIWMDRNLGASQVATSSADKLAFGSLYQWGRGSDGHELVNWTGSLGQDQGTGVNGTTSTLSASDTPGNSNFIITSGATNVDWRTGQNNNLWQGVNGINNPCPSGFRIPTGAEWAAEIASWSSQNAAGAFASPLKLTMAGQRNDGAGFFFAGQWGYYWSSTTANPRAQALAFSDTSLYNDSDYDNRGNGYSIRCIRN